MPCTNQLVPDIKSIVTNFYKTTDHDWLLISRVEGRKEMFYLTTHSTHFIYGYMALDIW